MELDVVFWKRTIPLGDPASEDETFDRAVYEIEYKLRVQAPRIVNPELKVSGAEPKAPVNK